MALAIATFITVGSVPVSALAEEPNSVNVIIEDLEQNHSGNLNDASKQNLNTAKTAVNAATTAETAASTAVTAAGSAKTASTEAQKAATNASKAADNAAEIAKLAEEAAKTLEQNGNVSKALADANTAISNADTAISTANVKAKDADEAISAADTAVQTVNDVIGDKDKAETLEGKANTALTDTKNAVSEIANAEAAKGKVDDKITEINTALSSVNAEKDILKGTDTTTGKINEVQVQIKAVEASYQKADDDALEKISDICTNIQEALKETDEDGKPTGRTLGEAAQLNANAAAQAKAEAEKERDQANTSLSNTWDNYYGVKRLVDNGSHDVAAAQQYAKKAADEAQAAEQAAANADAYAKTAALAESAAKKNYEDAQKALEDARKALDKAKEEYSGENGAYTKAKSNADTLENGDVKNLNNEIEAYNDSVKAIKDPTDGSGMVADLNVLIDDYNTQITKENGTNDAIDKANSSNSSYKTYEKDYLEKKGIADGKINDAKQAITDANNAIDDVEGKDGKRATAKAKLDAAEKALEDAQKDLETATAALNEASGISKTAAEYAEEAAQKASDAKISSDSIDEQVKISQTAVSTTKDSVMKLLGYGEPGKTFADLESDLKTAKEQTLPELQSNLQTVTREQNEIINQQNEIIAEKDGILNGENGLVAQKSNADKAVKEYQKEINDFEDSGLFYHSKIYNAREDKAKYEKMINDGGYWKPRLFKSDVWVKYTERELNDARANLAAAQLVIDRYDSLTGSDGLLATAKATQSRLAGEISAANSAKTNAQTAKTNASNLISQADKAVKDQKTLIASSEEKVNNVNSFAITNANAIVLDSGDFEALEKNPQYADLIAKIKADYGPGTNPKTDKSYVGIDKDATAYNEISRGFPHIITTLFPGTNGYNENAIEDKYGLKHVFNDGYNRTYLVERVNEKCVVICVDAAEASEFRATYAQIKIEKAKADAEAAVTAANTAKENAKAAAERAKSAQEREKAAKDAFVVAQNNLNDAKQAYANLGKTYDKFDEYDNTYNNTPESDNLNTYLSGLKDNETVSGRLDKNGQIKEYSKISNKDDFEIPELIQTTGIKHGEKLDLEKNASLLTALQYASKQLEDARKAYEDAQQDNKDAQDKLKKAQDYAQEAERVAKAASEMAKRIQPVSEDNTETTSDDSTDSGNNNESTSSSTNEGDVITTVASSNSTTGTQTTTTNRTTTNGANLNAQDANGSVSIDNNQMALSDGSDIKDTKVEDNKNNNPSKNIGENSTPLTAMPNVEDGIEFNSLWWLILVALFGVATATAMYQNYKKKAEAKQQIRKN